MFAFGEEGSQVVLVGCGQEIGRKLVLFDRVGVDVLDEQLQSLRMDVFDLNSSGLDLFGLLVAESGFEDRRLSGEDNAVRRKFALSADLKSQIYLNS